MRILNNIWCDEMRRRFRTPDVSSLDRVTSAEPTANEPPPDVRVEKRDMVTRIRDALATLPPPEQLALALVTYEGLTYREAARVQGCTEGTLAWRVFSARKRLAVVLAPDLEPAGGDENEM